ncbi:MAG: P-loop NTPase [Chloroflexota bacterium]
MRLFTSQPLRLVFLGLVLGGLIGGLAGLADPLHYQAATTLVVRAGSPGEPTGECAGDLQPDRELQRLVRDGTLPGRLEQVLGYPVAANQLQVGRLSAAGLLQVSVRSADPQQAAQIANALPAAWQQYAGEQLAGRYAGREQQLRTEIETLQAQISAFQRAPTGPDAPQRLAQAQQQYAGLARQYSALQAEQRRCTPSIVQTSAAAPPARPDFSGAVLGLLLGAAGGAGVGGLLGRAIAAGRPAIQTPADVQQQLGLPVLGQIPRLRQARPGICVLEEAQSPAAAAFHALAGALEQAAPCQPLASLLVTGVNQSAGKSTVAVNLAAVMAQCGRQVVLVDADLHRPALHRYLAIPNRAGLSELLRGQGRVDEVLIECAGLPLQVITCGGLPTGAAGLLASAPMERLLVQLQRQADLVIIDCAPSVVSDPFVLAGQVDGVLVVLEPGKTGRAAAQALIARLRDAGACIVGVALNPVSTVRAGGAQSAAGNPAS